MHRHRALSLPITSALLAIASPVAGQSRQVVPAVLDRAAAGAYTAYPLGLTAPIRLQTLYEAEETGLRGPVSVRTVALRCDEDRQMGAKSGVTISLEMSTTKIGNGGQSFRFASNRGANHRVVYGSKRIDLPAVRRTFPGAFALALPLDAPFRYDPAGGNLLIEYVITSQPAGSWVLDAPSPAGLGAHRPVAGGCRGFLDPKGGGIGRTISYSFYGGVKNAPALHILGFRRLTTSFPIPGSSGCFLHIDIQLLTPVTLNKNGDGSIQVPLPNLRGLVGSSVFAQLLLFASRLEISNASETVIGGPHAVARVYSIGTTTSLTGTPQDGAAHVIRLSY